MYNVGIYDISTVGHHYEAIAAVGEVSNMTEWRSKQHGGHG